MPPQTRFKVSRTKLLGLGLASLSFVFLATATSASAQTSVSIGPANVGKSTTAWRGPAEKVYTVNALPSWLSLEMEWRARFDDMSALGFVPGKDRAYVLTRVRGAFDARPNSWFEMYAQFHDTHAPGLPLRDVASNMRDNFDLRQGYINFHYKTRVQTYIGRQMLKFGDERVIGISDWTNNSRTWDGVDLRLDYPKWKVDMFSTSVVQIHPTSLDNHGNGLSFHGAWGDIMNVVPHTTFQPFVTLRTYGRVLSQQKVYGSETETTYGLENTGNYGRFDTWNLVDLQRGSYSNDSIHAGSAIVRAGYAIPAPWQPHIEAEYDYATGNPHRNPARIGTFDQQYPSNHNAFGFIDLFGFQNIKQRRMSVSFREPHGYVLLFQGESLHLASIHDGTYNGAGSAITTAPVGGFRSDDIGTNIDADITHQFHNGIDLDFGESHFFSGAAMTATPKGTTQNYAWVQLLYRFKANHDGK